METTRLRRVLGALAAFTGVAYLVVGVAGGIWPIVALLLALALIVLSVLYARRVPAAPTTT